LPQPLQLDTKEMKALWQVQILSVLEIRIELSSDKKKW